MPSHHEPKIQIVHFLVKDVRMCAYLKNVKKVLPLVALESIPGGPSYLAGLMNLQGIMIPVIDLAIRLGMKRLKKFSLDMPVLLLEKHNIDTKQIAVIIDDIIGLTDFDNTKLQLNHDFGQADSPFLGAVTDHLESSLLININYLIKDKILYES